MSNVYLLMQIAQQRTQQLHKNATKQRQKSAARLVRKALKQR